MRSLDLFSLKYEHILVIRDSICYYFLSRSGQKPYKRVNIIQKPWKVIVIKTSFQNLALKITYWKNFKSICNDRFSTTGKVSKYGVTSGPYFPAFGLNTERYFVSFSWKFLNPPQVNVPFLYPLKTSGGVSGVSDVFRGYRKGKSAWNFGLQNFLKILVQLFC